MEVLPANEAEQEKEILWLFDVALILKAIDGALEMLAAALVLIVPPAFVMKVVSLALAGELAQDPHDLVANVIQDVARAFSVSNHLLIAAYLALHGVIKVLLVIGIFARKRIAYPLFMTALAIFGTYEAYLGFMRQEILLQALAIFDLALLLLTSYEYRRRYPARLSSAGI